MNGLTVGELAREAGVHSETLRYYERRGLIPPPPRTKSGYRKYPLETVRRVRFIKRAQALGFTLEEVKDLFALRVQHTRGCKAIEFEAEKVIARVAERIAELVKMKAALSRLARACHDREATGECPILNALDEQDSMKPPEIELVYFHGCAQVETARAALKRALEAAGLPTEWREWDQEAEHAPEWIQAYASPTLLIDGLDMCGPGSTIDGRSCRMRFPSAEEITAMIEPRLRR